MKKLCVFIAICACGASFSMLTNTGVGTRNSCISSVTNATCGVFKRVGEFFKKPGSLSVVDLGGSLFMSGITFYQLANVRDKEVQIIRAIDERMDRFPARFLFNRSNDDLWKAREAVKSATDALNDSFKQAMLAGAISESAIKFAGFFNKASNSTKDGGSSEQKQRSDKDKKDKKITEGFPLTLSAMGAMAFYLDKIFELNHATKKAKRLLNTPKYKGEKEIK